jgi:anthranilate/para-aminobenzoate synthase component I
MLAEVTSGVIPSLQDIRGRRAELTAVDLFRPVRAVMDRFASPEDPYLGFYGAFGYDLALQFEPLRLRQTRHLDQRDLVLYIPDELVIVDHRSQRAVRHRYDFEFNGSSPEGIPAMEKPRRTRVRTASHDPATMKPANTRQACVWRVKLSSAEIFLKWFRDKLFLSPAPSLHRRSFAGCASVIRRRMAFLSIWVTRSIWWALHPKCTFG